MSTGMHRGTMNLIVTAAGGDSDGEMYDSDGSLEDFEVASSDDDAFFAFDDSTKSTK